MIIRSEHLGTDLLKHRPDHLLNFIEICIEKGLNIMGNPKDELQLINLL